MRLLKARCSAHGCIDAAEFVLRASSVFFVTLWLTSVIKQPSLLNIMALRDVLESSVRPGTLVEPLDERRIRCVACGHACPLPDGAAGVCKVRFNRGGTLYVPWGYVGGVQCDPVEKKPFFHVAARQPRATASACSAATCTVGIARTG